MYKPNRKRRRFDLTENNDSVSNQSDAETRKQSPHLYSDVFSGGEAISRKGYSYMKIQSSRVENDKSSKTREKFLYIILTAALITALVCCCLSILSMIIFFSIH